MRKKEINIEFAGEILQSVYWCRVLCIGRKKWRKRTVERFRVTGVFIKYSTEQFIDTWEYLEKEGLI